MRDRLKRPSYRLQHLTAAALCPECGGAARAAEGGTPGRILLGNIPPGVLKRKAPCCRSTGVRRAGAAGARGRSVVGVLPAPTGGPSTPARAVLLVLRGTPGAARTELRGYAKPPKPARERRAASPSSSDPPAAPLPSVEPLCARASRVWRARARPAHRRSASHSSRLWFPRARVLANAEWPLLDATAA